jgi:hypothetical protein
MKKLICGVVTGLMLALLAACSNPVVFDANTGETPSVLTIGTPVDETEELVFEPFEVILHLEDQGGRSVVGFDYNQIGPGLGLFNYSQVLVLDNAGKVVAFLVDRRLNAAQTGADFLLTGISNWDATYTFLVLMGHWERTSYTATGDYEYTAAPPTLLAAGVVTQKPAAKIPVSVAQIRVDTVFETTNVGISAKLRGPSIGQALVLPPVDWTVTWTLQGPGFTNLVTAEGKTPGTATIGDVFGAVSDKSQFNAADISGAPVPGGAGAWTLSKALSAYTVMGNIGQSGHTNFNVKYVPFAGKTWTGINLDGIPAGGKDSDKPLWILRNGINDAKQDGDTTFIANDWAGGKNGNGAVVFTVAMETASTLQITNASFQDSDTIQFTTGGYTGVADVYYAEVAEGDAAPAWGTAYTLVPGGPRAAATHTVAVPGIDASKDVYVILLKDGTLSAPVKLAKDASIVLAWPAVLYNHIVLPYYVKSDGSDTTGDGSKAKPYATVTKALAVIGAAYAGDWPYKGIAGSEFSAAIVIMGTVQLTNSLTISGNIPHILLCDDPDSPGGVLEGVGSPSNFSIHMVDILGSTTKVTLAGNLTLRCESAISGATGGLGGVHLYNGTLTMIGGTIRDFVTSFDGGVGVYGGKFIMTGGTITANARSGVYVKGGTVEIGGTAVISGNRNSGTGGGGVDIDGGKFTMTGGTITGNTTTDYVGGGLSAKGAIVTMTGGTITGNTAASGGGGVYFEAGLYSYPTSDGQIFNKTGGTIAGNTVTAGSGNGTAVRFESDKSNGSIDADVTGFLYYDYDTDTRGGW